MKLSSDQLRNLLILSQKGDKIAYEKFLNLILELIESKVKRKVFDINDQDDVVQSILLSIHKSLQTYDSQKEVLPWIATIAERRIIDYIRKYSRVKKYETQAPEGDVTFYGHHTKEILTGDLYDLLEGLPESMRTPIELTKIDGLSTKEASLTLGIKENALRTRISRGLGLLKKKLGGDNE